MAAQKGKDMLLKLKESGDPSFTTVAGLRTRSLALNAETVDITNADSISQWRELLDGAGIRSANISGAGVFKDDAADEKIRLSFFNGSLPDWQIILPDFGTIQGPFQITSLDYAGEHNGEITYELALQSAGVLTFTAG